MKCILRHKIRNSYIIAKAQAEEVVRSNRVKELISSGEILYLEKLNIHYRVCDVFTFENLVESCLEVRVIIDILEEDNIDRVLLEQLKTLEKSLGELLPTKRPENRGAREE